MTVLSRGQRSRATPHDAAKHLFSIGQSVRLKGGFGTSPKFGEIYRITGTLPARDNLFQYRVRHDDERHERVTTQDCLEPVGPERPDEGTTLMERTFGNGQRTETQQSRDQKAEAGESTAKT
ncbi:hypothetical protein [Mesorhizobium onobrychidis]|jgi:hypothetical protein|uniref:Uncharacterized protein n=3 Tax=Mesorhizobium TaxID=68287 RepID=A0A1R3VDK0_9HYPH|nr:MULTISPECIES: hypothetical protein [Mesorhizobium]UVC12722.1 hypothetical protein IHQ72_18205 [Mesorhizobium onobrychidis]SIT56882.1 conserved hypothetical protein [Mesorhizobium prunaredense]SJM31167.1 conserved hypothetical protein [Mesorhizobium delmotii]